MSKREKIIVGLMILVVIYGAYSLFFESSGTKPKGEAGSKAAKSVDVFVAEIAQSLSGLDLTGPGAYVMSRAETSWERDPFLDFELTPSGGGDPVVESIDIDTVLTYSGFLRMGNRGLAIINGMEYETGEMLEETGYVVKKITPTQVVVGVAGRSKEYVLLLTETE
jgi:hypothetical protein